MKEELYKRAIEYWGLEAQMIMLFEEMAELQQAISKHWRGKNSVEDIVQEIADVEVMLEQMQVAFKIERTQIDCVKEMKIKRLGELLKSETNQR